MLMEIRYIHLQHAFEGLKRTGIPLIEFNGTELLPSFTGDDLGIYIVIPQLALWLGISIDAAIALFFNGLFLIAFVVGLIGIFYAYRSWLQRFIATVGIFLLTRLVRGYNVYGFYAFGFMALTPWLFYFAKNNSKKYTLHIFFLIAGFICGFGHYMRAYSTGALALFLLIQIFAMHISKARKLSLISCMIIGLLLSVSYFSYAYNTYARYTNEYLSHYKVGQKQHVFWHAVYLGFGFLNFCNTDEIVWNDSCAERKVKSIEPNLTIETTDAYEAVLKNEVYKLVKHKLRFVLFTIFAKLGILFLYLVQYANVGLLAAIFYHKPFMTDFSWFVALAFNGIFPLMTMPFIEYSLGFIAVATCYGIVSINYAFECGALHDLYIIFFSKLYRIRRYLK